MRPCKNQKIISKCYHAFETFSNSENVKFLKIGLESANVMLPKFQSEELCFKFFKGDTLIWTVEDIINLLNSCQTKNIQLLKEHVEICLKEKSLQVYVNKL